MVPDATGSLDRVAKTSFHLPAAIDGRIEGIFIMMLLVTFLAMFAQNMPAGVVWPSVQTMDVAALLPSNMLTT
jgi:hypothetical protein